MSIVALSIRPPRGVVTSSRPVVRALVRDAHACSAAGRPQAHPTVGIATQQCRRGVAFKKQRQCLPVMGAMSVRWLRSSTAGKKIY